MSGQTRGHRGTERSDQRRKREIRKYVRHALALLGLRGGHAFGDGAFSRPRFAGETLPPRARERDDQKRRCGSGQGDPWAEGEPAEADRGQTERSRGPPAAAPRDAEGPAGDTAGAWTGPIGGPLDQGRRQDEGERLEQESGGARERRGRARQVRHTRSA